MDDTGLVNIGAPNYTINKTVAEPGRDSFSVTSLKINYDLQWADLTSVSSYAWRQFPRTTDGTYFNSVFVGFFVDQILSLPGLDGNLARNVLQLELQILAGGIPLGDVLLGLDQACS